MKFKGPAADKLATAVQTCFTFMKKDPSLQWDSLTNLEKWRVTNFAQDQLQYDDTHPRYKVVPRVVQYDPEWRTQFLEIDPNDAHLQTFVNHLKIA
jgi:hypothetical protein